MIRTTILLILATCLAGCADSSFKDEAEERAYLSSLGNPTPAQWKRLKQLDGSAAEAGRLTAERRASDAAASDWANAREYLAKGGELGPKLCRGILKNHPGTPEAELAREALAKLGASGP